MTQTLPPAAIALPSRPSHLHLTSKPKRHSKLSRTSSSKSLASSALEDDEDPMAGMFSQFCAVCEKQISVPSSSILYCSERCRAQDATMQSPYALFQKDVASPNQSPRLGSDSFFSPPPVDEQEYFEYDIIPQRSPTMHPRHQHHQSLSLSAFHRGSSFEDVTALSTSSPGRGRPRTRADADSSDEESRYFGQFQSMPTHEHFSSFAKKDARPRFPRGLQSGFATAGGPPSLSHTPGSSFSASGTSSLFTSSNNSYFAERPLPPRTAPGSSSTTFGNRSIDLVTPLTEHPSLSASYSSAHGSDDTLVPDVGGLHIRDPRLGSSAEHFPDSAGLSYEKRKTASSFGGEGRLKAMFEFESMRAPAAKSFR